MATFTRKQIEKFHADKHLKDKWRKRAEESKDTPEKPESANQEPEPRSR